MFVVRAARRTCRDQVCGAGSHQIGRGPGKRIQQRTLVLVLSSSLAVGTLGLLHPSAAGASVPKPPQNATSSQPGSILQPNGEPSVFWVGANNVLFNYWYVSGSWYSATIAGQGSGDSSPLPCFSPTTLARVSS